MDRTTRHDPVVPRAKKNGHGGARPGSGRPSIYGDPLSVDFCVRLNADQGRAIARWCTRDRIPVGAMMREVALPIAGASSLGVGLDKVRVEEPVQLDVGADGTKVIVKVTERQATAMRAHCRKKNVAVSTWLREVALRYVGSPELGAEAIAASARA